jgi:hypothetical protein
MTNMSPVGAALGARDQVEVVTVMAVPEGMDQVVRVMAVAEGMDRNGAERFPWPVHFQTVLGQRRRDVLELAVAD